MEKPTRTIEFDRLFFLGQYKNIRIKHSLDGIPDKVWLNPEAVEKLTTLLLLAVERDFRRYQQLNQEIGGMSLEESLAYLSELRDETYKEIQDILNNGDTEE